MGFLQRRPPGPTERSQRWAAGIHPFGFCDHVEGLGRVATEFFHLGPLLLFPVGGTFVLEDGDIVPMPLSWKSVLIAYVRTYGLIALAACPFLTLNRLIAGALPSSAADMILQPWGLLALACIAAALATVPLARPTAARRRALCAYLGREPAPLTP